MLKFTTQLKKFTDQGEKTGWTYIEVRAELAKKLNPGVKKSFQVKGKLDDYSFSGINLLPMGGGDFILSINAQMRKGLKKRVGTALTIQIELDTFVKPLSVDFMECLKEEPKALTAFNSLAPSHQKYFSNWIESAKTISTKTTRITKALIALSNGYGFSEMLRMNKKEQ